MDVKQITPNANVYHQEPNVTVKQDTPTAKTSQRDIFVKLKDTKELWEWFESKIKQEIKEKLQRTVDTINKNTQSDIKLNNDAIMQEIEVMLIEYTQWMGIKIKDGEIWVNYDKDTLEIKKGELSVKDYISKKMVEDVIKKLRIELASGWGGGVSSSWWPTTADKVGYIRDGYSSRFNESVDVDNVNQALDQIFEFTSVDPTVSISASPSFGLREFGDNVVDPIITASAITWQNPVGTLTLLEFVRWAVIDTVDNPTPSTNYSTTDTFTVSSNQTYTANITDDQARTGTASGSYSFVYPFYRGAIVDGEVFDGITRAEFTALADVSLQVRGKADALVTTTPTSQKYLFMYPASYWNLTSIIDDNGFETLPDYDIYDRQVIWLDATSQTYKVYILKWITTQVSFTNNYKF